jgi:(R,R)-butanediol dehydrogenase/meso-butanediol dehydrogenase/diacetyl reductase
MLAMLHSAELGEVRIIDHLVVQYRRNGDFKAFRAPTEPPGDGEVQISVAYTGICGTDLKIAHGAMDSRISSPWPIGHEMSGTLAEVGAGVEGWAQGDRVTVMPLDWCGRCPACDAGHSHICHNLNFVGIDSPGSLQEKWNVRADLLVRLPADLGLRSAALVEPVAVAVHDVRRAQLSPTSRVVVIGGGPIGILIALVARHQGADVIVSEVNPFRAQFAADLDFVAVNPGSEDLNAVVEDWTAGKGADCAFEVSGSPAGVAALTEVLAVRGRGVIVAIHPEPQPFNLFQMFWKELEIVGTRVYQRTDFEEAIRLLTAGVIPADTLITDVMPLSEASAAIERLSGGEDIVKLLVASSQ